MATKESKKQGDDDVRGGAPGETEPGPLLGEDEADEVAGIPGQIIYPDVEVDAERAGNFVAGNVDTLDPDEEEKSDRERIQDDIDNYPRDEDAADEDETA